MEAALDSDDLIDFLIINGSYFDGLSLEDKLKLKTARPTPVLSMKKKESSGNYIRRFQKNWYTNFIWLTGSATRNKLFCFYCLLFSNNDTEWCKTGVGEESLKNITARLKKHESSANHVFAAVKFVEMGTARRDHAQMNAAHLAVIEHNENVDRNRLIVKRLISTTCFLARQELAFRGHDGSENSLNKGNYLEILDFLAEEESHMKTHLIYSTVFKGTSCEIQNELIECVTDVVNELILNEIKYAHFISMQVDETTDVSVERKLSVIMRYANMLNGEIEERFIGFYDVSEDKTPQGLANILVNVLKKWKIGENKLVSQTYDGAITMTRKPGAVHTIVKQKYRHAIFLHSFAYHLNLLLLHGSKTIKQVKLFVANLTAFHTFFSDSSKRMPLLRKKGFKLPDPSEAKWNFHSQGVATILTYFIELKASMQDILQSNGWDSNTISLAIGLKRSLNDIEFVFLLQLYNKIFEYTSALFDFLQMENTDVRRCNIQVQNCLYLIKKLRNEETVQMCAEESEKLLSKNNVCVEEEMEEYSISSKFNDRLLIQMRLLSFKILDNVIANMESRFQELPKLEFLDILNEVNFKFYSTPKNFPNSYVDKLVQIYPFFDKVKLKGELMYIYGSEDKKMSPKELFKFVINNNLKDVLCETVKLLSLILCIPATSALCKSNTSTLKRIKTFLRNNMMNEGLSNLATLAIEKRLVKASVSQQGFISRTIDVFAEKKTRRSELIYKKIEQISDSDVSRPQTQLEPDDDLHLSTANDLHLSTVDNLPLPTDDHLHLSTANDLHLSTVDNLHLPTDYDLHLSTVDDLHLSTVDIPTSTHSFPSSTSIYFREESHSIEELSPKLRIALECSRDTPPPLTPIVKSDLDITPQKRKLNSQLEDARTKVKKLKSSLYRFRKRRRRLADIIKALDEKKIDKMLETLKEIGPDEEL